MSKSLFKKAEEAAQAVSKVEPEVVQTERCARITVRAELRLRNDDLISARKRYGLSQIHLAEAVSVPLYVISALEMFNYSNVNIETYARRIADFLELSLDLVLPPELLGHQLPATVVTMAQVDTAQLLDVTANTRHLLSTTSLDAVEHEELSSELQRLLATLTVKEGEVIKLRFGLDGLHPHTLAEAGTKLHVNKERARQIEAKALRKLQHPRRTHVLEQFLEGLHDAKDGSDG